MAKLTKAQREVLEKMAKEEEFNAPFVLLNEMRDRGLIDGEWVQGANFNRNCTFEYEITDKGRAALKGTPSSDAMQLGKPGTLRKLGSETEIYDQKELG